MNSPDLNDPEIRALLDCNHVPKETKVVSGHDTSRIVETRVACAMCDLPYPCPTRQALRDREKLAKENQLRQTMRSSPHQACGDRRPHGEHMYTGFTRGFYCPGAPSRSSALHRAVALLRMSEIEDAYAAAWDEWQEAGEHDLWATVSGDGTDYEYVDCDDVISRSHKAHAWNFRGADYWCSGG